MITAKASVLVNMFVAVACGVVTVGCDVANEVGVGEDVVIGVGVGDVTINGCD